VSPTPGKKEEEREGVLKSKRANNIEGFIYFLYPSPHKLKTSFLDVDQRAVVETGLGIAALLPRNGGTFLSFGI
jgi:hypothetical protein